TISGDAARRLKKAADGSSLRRLRRKILFKMPPPSLQAFPQVLLCCYDEYSARPLRFSDFSVEFSVATDRHWHGWPKGSPGPVDRRYREFKVLADDNDGIEESRSEGHLHCLRGLAQRISGLHTDVVL